VITPADADELAAQVLGDRVTEQGVRQIEHARRVAVAVVDEGDRAVVAALLHETVEQRCIAWGDLADAVDDDEVTHVVDVLTRRSTQSELAYLRRCARHPVAAVVKRTDLLEELDPPEVDVGCTRGAMTRRRTQQRLALLHRLIDEQST
jgi:(p)ppGpp synthase/HD superfamily hydrolase